MRKNLFNPAIFADIHKNNELNNLVLPVVVSEEKSKGTTLKLGVRLKHVRFVPLTEILTL